MSIGIRTKKRKLKPKYASSVKKQPKKQQAFDDGYRYGFNCYKPIFSFTCPKLEAEFNRGFYAGLNGESR